MKHALSLFLLLVIVTAFNAGDPAQTDLSACISASGHNICDMLVRGVKVCAANSYKFGTKLSVPGYGTCTVLDRTARKYSDRIDVAFKRDEKKEALKWGMKRLNVTKL